MTFFSEKISVFTATNFDDIFFSHRPGFSDFPFLFPDFPCLYCVIYDPFFTRKTTISEKNSLTTPFFRSVRTFAPIRQHYFSKYWGGTGCMGRSRTSNLGGPSPQSPLGLRPWACRAIDLFAIKRIYHAV